MSFGAGDGSNLSSSGGMLASEANRDACQAVLKQAYEDQRLTLEEFEARVGKAISARTLDQLADLTKDLPATPAAMPAVPARSGRSGRFWLLIAGIAVPVLAGVLIAVIATLGSGTSPSSTGVPQSANGAPQPVKEPAGPAHCPVGTSQTALTIANALAADPVYVDPTSPPLTTAQADRLRTAITTQDPGRIRIAALTPATVSAGGGERSLTNAIASCPAVSAGVTVVTTATSTYLVTSYANDKPTTSAVGAALNTHSSLAAGLIDAVKRMATLDNARS